MTECDHRWIDDGEGRSRVRCSRCGVRGTVTIETPPPTHLQRAREDYHAATMVVVMRGSPGYLAHLEGAIGHLICHLEGRG